MLEDIFDRWEIRDETAVIKSDNAPTRYKSKWAFESYSYLTKKYNVQIIRIYGAAAHRKGLIDVMSSFGVKSILKRDILAWLGCIYSRMSYSVIDKAAVDKKRMEKIARKIDGCMVKELFDYKTDHTTIYATEFLCDCDNSLDFRFVNCSRKQTSHGGSLLNDPDVQDVIPDDCYLDVYDEEHDEHVYEFLIIPSFVVVVSYNSCEPVYIIKIEEMK